MEQNTEQKNPPQAIEVAGASVSYGNVSVLEDVSFTVPSGSITSIIGPNGSGKTTLLKACLGLIPLTRGKIRVLGGTPTEVRRHIGYVPQRFDFDRTFPVTVSEFIEFSAPDVSAKKIKEYLQHLGSVHLLQKRLGELSGGELQRVLIVRAMLHDPEILYLDEPASGIDIGGEQSLYELITHLHEEHFNTIVMVSHEVDVVYGFSDNVICINKHMVCNGPPSEALTPKVLESLYGKGVGIHKHR